MKALLLALVGTLVCTKIVFSQRCMTCENLVCLGRITECKPEEKFCFTEIRWRLGETLTKSYMKKGCAETCTPVNDITISSKNITKCCIGDLCNAI